PPPGFACRLPVLTEPPPALELPPLALHAPTTSEPTTSRPTESKLIRATRAIAASALEGMTDIAASAGRELPRREKDTPADGEGGAGRRSGLPALQEQGQEHGQNGFQAGHAPAPRAAPPTEP